MRRRITRIFDGSGARRRRAAELVLEHDAGARSTSGLAPDPGLESELTAMRGLAETLGQMPPQAWALGAPRPVPGVASVPRGARSRARVAIATLVAACALALSFLAGSLTHPRSAAAPAVPAGTTGHVLLSPLVGSLHGARAVAYMAGAQRMELVVSGLPRARPGTYYELWLMSSTTDLVPLASFRVDRAGGARLELVLPADPGSYRFLDVSLQRVSAPPSISTDSVLRGAIRG